MPKKQKRDVFRPEEFDERDEGPSRSQLKRDMHALQQLGADLAALGGKVVREASLPSEVEEALLLIPKLKKHEAKRRHMQYVGKLMRTFDTGHVREIVEAAREGHQIKTAEFHRVEKLRDRLIDGDDGLLQELFDAHPDDGRRIRQRDAAQGRSRSVQAPALASRARIKITAPPP